MGSPSRLTLGPLLLATVGLCQEPAAERPPPAPEIAWRAVFKGRAAAPGGERQVPTCVVASEDADRAFVATTDDRVCAVSLARGEALWEAPIAGGIKTLAASEALVAVGTTDDALVLLSASDGSTQRVKLQGALRRVHVCGALVVGLARGEVVGWERGEETWRVPLALRGGPHTSALAGFTLLANTRDGELVALDANSGHELFRRPSGGDVFSTEEEGVALCLHEEEQALDALDVRSGRVLWTASLPEKSMAVQPGLTRILLAAGSSRTALDAQTGERLFTTRVHGSGPVGEVFQSERRLLLQPCSSHGLHRVDADTGEALPPVALEGERLSGALALRAGGRLLVFATADDGWRLLALRGARGEQGLTRLPVSWSVRLPARQLEERVVGRHFACWRQGEREDDALTLISTREGALSHVANDPDSLLSPRRGGAKARREEIPRRKQLLEVLPAARGFLRIETGSVQVIEAGSAQGEGEEVVRAAASLVRVGKRRPEWTQVLAPPDLGEALVLDETLLICAPSSVQALDLQRGRPLWRLGASAATFLALAAVDRERVIALDSTRLRLVRARTGEVEARVEVTHEGGEELSLAAAGPTQAIVRIGHPRGTLQGLVAVDLEAQAVAWRAQRDSTRSLQAGLSDDGGVLLVAFGEEDEASTDSLECLEFSSGETRWAETALDLSGRWAVGGERVAVGAVAGSPSPGVVLRDTGSGRVVASLDVEAVALAFTDRLLLVLTAGRLLVLNARSGERLAVAHLPARALGLYPTPERVLVRHERGLSAVELPPQLR